MAKTKAHAKKARATKPKTQRTRRPGSARTADDLWSLLGAIAKARTRCVQQLAGEHAPQAQGEERFRDDLSRAGLQALDAAALRHGTRFVEAALREYERTYVRTVAAPMLTATFANAVAAGASTGAGVLAVFEIHLQGGGLRSEDEAKRAAQEQIVLIDLIARVLDSGDRQAAESLKGNLRAHGVSEKRIKALAQARGVRNQSQALAGLLLDVDTKTIQRAEANTALGRLNATTASA